MKHAFPLLALTAGEAAAQFFVLYGRDSMTARIDPILEPGSIGTHVHDFMGANNANENSTFESLREASCTSMGRANGNPIVEDRSAYWHPALYVKSNSGEYIQVPTNGHQIYYENSGTGTMRDPFEFPEGFRMIAGNAYLRAPLEHSPTNRDNITQWICHESPVWNQGNSGGFPNGVTSCNDYPYFNGAIHFPHCWNGKDYNPAKPYHHVSYPVGDIQNGPCPDSHPIRLPHIMMENDFDLSGIQGQFQENTFVLANGDPTGYSWHADFYNGWQPGVLHNLLTGPTSCFSHDVGDCSGVTFDTSMNVAQCTGTNPYPEELDGPLPALPGCNPITTQNPAAHCKACPAGVVGGACTAPTSDKAAKKKKKKIQAKPTVVPESTTTVTVMETNWLTKTVTSTVTNLAQATRLAARGRTVDAARNAIKYVNVMSKREEQEEGEMVEESDEANVIVEGFRRRHVMQRGFEHKH